MRRSRSGVLVGACAAAFVLAVAGCGTGGSVAADPSPPSPPSASAGSAGSVGAVDVGPVQFRVVTATSQSPPSDSQTLQRLSGLRCADPARPVPAGRAEAACDADGVKYLLEPAFLEGGVDTATATAGRAGWVVDVHLDAHARTVLAQRALRLRASRGQLAVVLDGSVVSAPRVAGPVTGGDLEIAGGITETNARALATALQAGG